MSSDHYCCSASTRCHDIFRRNRCARRIISACVTPDRNCPFFLRNSLFACANALDIVLSVLVFFRPRFWFVLGKIMSLLNCPDDLITSRPLILIISLPLDTSIVSGSLIIACTSSVITKFGSLTMAIIRREPGLDVSAAAPDSVIIPNGSISTSPWPSVSAPRSIKLGKRNGAGKNRGIGNVGTASRMRRFASSFFSRLVGTISSPLKQRGLHFEPMQRRYQHLQRHGNRRVCRPCPLLQYCLCL